MVRDFKTVVTIEGSTLTLSGQYWINEWDMANALKCVVNYTTLDGTQM